MKQLLKKVMIVISICMTLESASAYDFEVDGIYYSVLSLEDMTCEVVNGDVEYESNIIIPAEITYNTRSLSVTAIGSEAFCKCRSLISVNLPNSVTSIGNNAFEECSSLESIIIPNSVTFIGYSAFRNCSSLLSVTIPDSVTSILYGSFCGCSSLNTVSIPESVTTIEAEAFANCTSIESIKIPNSVTSLGLFKGNNAPLAGGVFSGCTYLKSVILSNSLTEIPKETFSMCSSLNSIVIPNSVTSIGSSAFDGCSSLETIEIPNSVTSIGTSAFKGCSSLESVSLSDSLEEIPYGLFNGCKMLKELEIPGSVSILCQYRYDDGAYVQERYINKTFGECDNLEKISLFYNETYYLATVYTFWYRTGGEEYCLCGWESSWTKTIKKLYLDRYPYNPITVPNLEELEIGEHMEEVRIDNISEMENLSIIKSYALIPPELPEITNVQYMNINVYVPEESLDAYKADPIWGKFWNISSVDSVNNDFEKTVTERYDLSGKIVNEDYKGLVIVRFSDGSVKKRLQ